MKYFCPLIALLVFLAACRDNRSAESAFDYDPSVPYPVLQTGEFWPDKFDQRGLQNAVIIKDRLFCNTIDPGGDQNFLYCLSPVSGLALWHKNVKAYATQTVSLCKDRIIYCSYLGDIAAFTMEGELVWQAKFGHPYGGHWVDTAQSRLLVKTVYWKNVSIYDIRTGAMISDTANDSLQHLIGTSINAKPEQQRLKYRIEHDKKIYNINCGPGNKGAFKIEINSRPR